MILRRSVNRLAWLVGALLLLSACAAVLGKHMAGNATTAEGAFIELPGGRIHAVVRGQGPDLVLIHGASGNVRDFSFDLVDRLTRDYRVIALDRPGFGFSDPFGGLEDPIEQAELLRAASLSIGVERPLVLGHSYGGAVALAWALRDGDGLAGLTLLAPASHPWPGELGLWYRLTDTALGRGLILPAIGLFAPRGAIEGVVSRVFRPDTVPEGYLEHLGIDLTMRASQLMLNARQINSLRGHLEAMSAGYPALTLPIEVIHGKADRVVGLPYHTQRLVADIGSARLTALEGIGHMPHHARPDAVVEAIHRTAARAGLR